MSIKKLIAIGIIYLATCAAWLLLGVSNFTRTDQSYRALKSEVVSLYGDTLIITAPQCYSTLPQHQTALIDGKQVSKEYFDRADYELATSDIAIQVNLDQRKKGNLWFPTFKAKFSAHYEFKLKDVPEANQRHYYIYTTLASSNSIYNDIQLSINNEQISNVIPLIRKKAIEIVPAPDGTITLDLSYASTGMEHLIYYISPDPNDISQLNDFSLKLLTDFNNYDFPTNMMSPLEQTAVANGSELIWKFNNSVTGKDIGIVIPNKLNPGAIVSRVTLFAPVSLLFFFFVLFVISIIVKVALHPMHYFFLAATFFSFHLMYSYFSDHINIYVTFAIASVVSLLLTITYLRAVTSRTMAYVYAPLTQFIYLIIFSYSFFFKGMTGVIVTICSVITLFILMQITARVNWEHIFMKKE